MELLCVSHPLERIIPGVEFAPEIVGNGRNGIVGPFEAQCRVGSIENRLVVFCEMVYLQRLMKMARSL